MAKRSGAIGWAGLVTLVAAGVVMLVASSTAAAQVSCGATIVQDTKLDRDLDCPDTALTIGADDVTLDLAGHEITGHGQGVGVINLKWQAFVLERGRIAGFEAGALLGDLTATGPSEPNGYRVERVEFEDNREAGLGALGNDGVVSRVTTTGNGGNGVSLIGSRNHVERVTASGNGEQGIRLTNAFNVPAVDNVIERNVVEGSGSDGIFVSARQTLVARNDADRNAGNGIAFQQPSDGSIVTRNSADQNQGHGIEGVPGIVDGGHNHAQGNALSPQCVEVVCSP
jgi:Right handed beta helix region